MSDESDSEEHYYSGSEEDDESHESDSDDVNHGLLDLEASEGSSDPESDADEFSDAGSYAAVAAEYSFPKFMQLPPEIREMIWAAFCPDLGSEPRVFELHLHTVISPPGAVHLPTIVHGIVAGPQLESQTEPMRAVLAVHRESRALALKSAPNEFSLSDGELVRYHEERDVLLIAWQEEILLRGIALRFQELGIEAQNLAFPSNIIREHTDDLVDLMYLLPQTRKLFLLDEEEDLQDLRMSIRDYAWTVGDMVHKYRLDTEEEGEIGLLVPISRIFCWPDLDNYREFAEEHVRDPGENVGEDSTVDDYRRRLRNPLEDSRELNQNNLSDEEKTEAIDRLRSIEVWPMVRFNFNEGLDRFHYIDTRARFFPDQMSEPESPPKYMYIQDVYESDGINDDPLDDSTSIDDYDEMLAQDLAQQFFQSHGSSDQSDNSSEIDELPPANFSSDEEPEEPDQVTSDSEDGSASQARAARPMRRVVESDSDGSATETHSPRPSKRRSRVAISDSEDDEEGSSDAEPVRGANRRARAIPMDSEDEEGHDDDADVPQPSRSGRRRGRAVPIDSDDDDDEEGLQQPSEGRKSRRRVLQEESDEEDEDGESDSQGGGAKTKDSGSSDDEEQSSSDDEDDVPPPPKRMSLANRLRMESRQDRSRHVDHDDSEADGMNGDGYGYSDDQEDEVDKSDSDLMTGGPESFEGEDGESEGGY